MLAQARAELPNECCGLLAGTTGADGTARVTRRYPLVNAAASPTEYLSDARSMLAAERDRRRLGLEFLAVYHSHPTSDPVPSRRDLERSEWWPGVMQFIVSLKGVTPTVRAWWLTPEDALEAEWSILDA
jgi:proteasome lid subunit RPN8/RPN11